MMAKQELPNKESHIEIHHYSLKLDVDQLLNKITDVRLVLIAGCWRRTLSQANYLAERLIGKDGHSFELEKLTDDKSRFFLIKVGPVLLSDHGMGGPSMSIALHELFLMCREANILDKILLIRFGTSGGLGIEPGSVCLTNKSYDPLFNDYVELKIVGKIVRRPCIMDLETVKFIEQLLKENPNHEELGAYKIEVGATVASNDFYEEQARTNGVICDHTIEDKMRFLHEAQSKGVKNFEMESNYLSAMCHKLGVRFGLVCITLADRFVADFKHYEPGEIRNLEQRLFWMNLLLARKVIEETKVSLSNIT